MHYNFSHDFSRLHCSHGSNHQSCERLAHDIYPSLNDTEALMYPPMGVRACCIARGWTGRPSAGICIMSCDNSEKSEKSSKTFCTPEAKKLRQQTQSLFLSAARHWRCSESYYKQNKPGIFSHTECCIKCNKLYPMSFMRDHVEICIGEVEEITQCNYTPSS